MFRITFPIFYAFVYSLSLLPLGLWYLFSDFLFFILYYVIGYRKKVAYSNLKRCFPEKSEQEIQSIMRETYHHTADVFVEFFKEISMSEEELCKRMVVKNPEAFREIEQKGKGVILLATHYGNFEWMTTRTVTSTKFHCYGVYAPLGSPYFEELAHRGRLRWGGGLIPAKNAISVVAEKLEGQNIIGFICDQTPSRSRILYFTDFFGQVTAVHDRFANLAVQKQTDIYFVDVRSVKRGYYTMELVLLPTQEFQPYTQENVQALTDRYTKMLESVIREQPQYWLWTHKRWKHEPKEGDILSKSLNTD